ncbi:MAG: hypothetical protein EZS28_050770 [Streblomastix strix]|uniref:Uncharacterized protein n=1 Tax=Streblomastix strix TaxID=222440 RepID=A0A5J4T7F4_9EUKA|nr:MAG: hypothetical protein EZS28_050770 [Streblomastix strix]
MNVLPLIYQDTKKAKKRPRNPKKKKQKVDSRYDQQYLYPQQQLQQQQQPYDPTNQIEYYPVMNKTPRQITRGRQNIRTPNGLMYQQQYQIPEPISSINQMDPRMGNIGMNNMNYITPSQNKQMYPQDDDDDLEDDLDDENDDQQQQQDLGVLEIAQADDDVYVEMYML